MYLTANSLKDPRMVAHYKDQWQMRNMASAAQKQLLAAYQSTMPANVLEVNQGANFGQDFWAEIDREILQSRDQATGMEIVNDLMNVQTSLDIGKTASFYNLEGDIADDVRISIDGQGEYSFDHTDYEGGGDPIPVFTFGYGVNWRHALGMRTINVDLVLDSQRAKVKKYHKRLVDYMLNGDSNIVVKGLPGQGIKNHRNTSKINLGAAGANIDLTTATPAQIVEFFSKGAFGQNRLDNHVDVYDKLWVSPQINLNLDQPYIEGGVRIGMLKDVLRERGYVRSIEPTFALDGNEFIGYQLSRAVISPLVGAPLTVVPVPRLMPQSNFNFQGMSVIGLRVVADAQGRSGVVYGGEA